MQLIDVPGELDGWTHQDRWDRDWLADAACLGHPEPDLWFATSSDAQATRRAREVCVACPVRADCLNYALTHDEQHGVWGGLDEDGREQLRRRLRLPRPHGTHARYQAHLKAGEQACAECARAHADYVQSWKLGAHQLDQMEAV